MTQSPRVISINASGQVQTVEDSDIRKTRERLTRLAWLLDSSIPIPGTRLTIGLDPLIGLFPFFGDLIGVLLSSYILREAARLGAPRIVLMRMALNVGMEGLIGMIPFAGDIFDAAWKANRRNVRLLDAWLARRTRTERSSRLFGLLLVLAVGALLALVGVGAFYVLKWTIGLLG